ncbi:MAG: LysM peptidoglycan-binding domain-containing protein, partial [Opitutaceae bacterium]
LFALILIFANPGCSSTTKPAPSPGDTSSGENASPIVAAPNATPAPALATSDPAPASSAITFNPDTPAAAAPASTDPGVRFTPTRPGTPVAGALLAEPVADVTPATSYTVKSGDNLWTIARRNNITLAQLTAANRLSANATLRPGQKLIIPGKSTPASAIAPAAGATARTVDPLTTAAIASAGPDVVKHVVKSGETLGAIARRYGVRQGELAVANNISDPAKIRPGLELVIPGWKAPASKSGKSPAPANGTGTPLDAPASVDPLVPQPAPSTPPPVPVIQIDETPAPKQP